MNPFDFPPRAAVYQIFVDRFAGQNGEELTLPEEAGKSPWGLHAGGNLYGIERRLDHITQLGCDAIYLTPIFTAPSNHKYDVADYLTVDEHFGGDEAFKALERRCRELELGLVLDGVFNHVGRTHPWFLRAQQDAHSREASYFTWLSYPNDYECWQSHNTLPELNLDHPDVLGFLIRNEDSVVRHWLRRGATGWRLDCANDLGPTLCSEIAQVVASEGGRDGAIGEVMAYAEEFVQAGGLHGVMNYYFRATVLALIGGEISASQAAANFKRMARRYHYPALLRSWNILASHDTPRLASELESPESRKLAFALACAFPGVPMIYYGEEVGMHGGPDPINRAPMVWRENEWDHEILEFVRHLINLRRQSPALLTGGYESLPQPAHPDVLAFARTGEHPQDTVIVLANVSDRRAEGRFFIPLSSMFDSLPLHDLLHEGRRTHMESGAMRTELAPYDVAFFSPVDVKKPRYSFFSGYKANGTAQ